MSKAAFDTGPAGGDYGVDADDQLQQEDTLLDRGVHDVLDEGYSPPERAYASSAFATQESMDQLLAEQEWDPTSRIGAPVDAEELKLLDEAEREWDFPEVDEVGRARAGRLVAPDMGFGEDAESQLVAEDVGISGGAASAEEAAVHIIDDEI